MGQAEAALFSFCNPGNPNKGESMKRKNPKDVKPNKIYQEFEYKFQEAIDEVFEQQHSDVDDQEYFIKSAKNRAVRQFFETAKEYKEAAKLIKENYSYE